MTCADCGERLRPGTRFCIMCGRRQSAIMGAVRRSTSRRAAAPPIGALITELVEGETLLDWRSALELTVAVCRAISAAHTRGYVALALETRAFYVERGDAGWVVTALAADTQDTRDREQHDTTQLPSPKWGVKVNTVASFAPERLMGKRLDRATEVYEVGLIAYELVVGRAPFADADGPAALITAQLRHLPPTPSVLHPDARIPPAVDALLLRCLAKGRYDRYADVDELARAIGEVLAGEPVLPPHRVKRLAVSTAQRAPAHVPRRVVLSILDAKRCTGKGCKTGHLLTPGVRRTIFASWLFLDHFDTAVAQRPPGTPHPHVGMAAMTYLFEGRVQHRDSLGNTVTVERSDLSWMYAGRGAVHVERAIAMDAARGLRMHGLELWVALPRPNEDDAPAHVHHRARDLPSVVIGGARVRVVVGEGFGVQSPLATPMPLAMFDARLPTGGSLPIPSPSINGYERALYVVDGAILIGEQTVRARQLALLAPGASVGIRAAHGKPAHVVGLGCAPMIGPRHSAWHFTSTSQARLTEAKQRWIADELGTIPGETERTPYPSS